MDSTFFFCTQVESSLEFYIENIYTFLSPFTFFICIFFLFFSFLIQIFEKNKNKQNKKTQKLLSILMLIIKMDSNFIFILKLRIF